MSQASPTSTRSTCPFLNLPFTTGDVRRTIGYTVPYPLKHKDPRIPFGHRRASGNIFYDHNLMLHGYTISFANWDIVHPHLHRQLRPQALDDVQAHYNLLYKLLHSTFCTGEVFVPCRQPAAAFRAHMLTTIPLRIQRQYAWGPAALGAKMRENEPRLYPRYLLRNSALWVERLFGRKS